MTTTRPWLPLAAAAMLFAGIALTGGLDGIGMLADKPLLSLAQAASASGMRQSGPKAFFGDENGRSRVSPIAWRDPSSVGFAATFSRKGRRPVPRPQLPC